MRGSALVGLALLGAIAACAAERTPPGIKGPAGSSGSFDTPANDDGADGGMGGTTNDGGAGAGDTAENCFDAQDNDGNGFADCEDDACADACNAPCAAPFELSDPGQFSGSTTGHAELTGASCTSNAGAGASHVFSVVAQATGVLDATLISADSQTNFALSARTSCDDANAELACVDAVIGHEGAGAELLSVTVNEGDTVYLVVQGYSFLDDGGYTLYVETRVPTCGDAIIDAGEECDDGNVDDPNDGCDADCVFQPTELEPNDDDVEANPFVARWFAEITEDDDDFVVVDAPADNYGFVISVLDLGDGACARAEMDSYIEHYDAQFEAIGYDDDSGDGLCAELVSRDVAAGSTLVMVSASPDGFENHSFKYELAIEGDICGNGSVGGPEECDDGNLTEGDGCSEVCTVE